MRILVILMSLLSDDPLEVGYFVTSTRVVELLAGLPALLGAVILPVLTLAARDDPQRMQYMTARLTEAMALGGVLVALAVAFAAPSIITVLGGTEYEGAVGVLQLQCLALVTLFVAASWNQTLIGRAISGRSSESSPRAWRWWSPPASCSFPRSTPTGPP